MQAYFPRKIIVRIKIEMYLMYLNQQGIHFGFKISNMQCIVMYEL